MMAMGLFIIVFIGLCLCLFSETVSGCVFSQIFRHGDRAPVYDLPIDTFNESHWPYGYGQLTDVSNNVNYTTLVQ